MKQGWKIKKLGEVLSLEYGKPLPKEKRIHKGLYPVYGANGIINRTNEYYVDETSIIVGRKGSAGEINYTEEKFWPLDVTYYTKFDKNELNLNFLYYLLSLLELPKLAKGVKPGINRNDIYAIKTFIPFLSEQKRIVSKLDQCFEAIDKARANVERNRQNAKELFQSRKNDLFKKLEEDVSKVPLPSVCDEIFAGGDAPKGNYSKEKAEKFNIPIFANAVKDNGLYGYTN
ncbi:restriction endonuclease subunit S, partial [bacterium]|nr:restriction endonuclease subunit S [bacterium]